MPDPENKLSPGPATSETALLVRDEPEQEAGEPSSTHDTRLHNLRMQLDVLIKVRSLRVGDLLGLTVGAVLETVHEHSQDLPVRCGTVLLMWAEFEVVEQRLAVRVTRLA